MRSQPRPHGSVWIKGIYVSTHAYIRLDSCVYTSWRIPIYVSAQSYIRVGECLHGRWRMPVQALADACESGVHGAKTTN